MEAGHRGKSGRFDRLKEIAKKYADTFPKIELVTIKDFGGWKEAQKKHFDDGGVRSGQDGPAPQRGRFYGLGAGDDLSYLRARPAHSHHHVRGGI